MSAPDSARLETLSLAEVCELVTLVAKVADLEAAHTALKGENHVLRDEVARLKGLPPRPPLAAFRDRAGDLWRRLWQGKQQPVTPAARCQARPRGVTTKEVVKAAP